MLNVNLACVPLNKSLACVEQSQKLNECVSYKKAVSSLMYIPVLARSNIAYSTGILFRIFHKPSKHFLCLVKKVLKYLRGT